MSEVEVENLEYPRMASRCSFASYLGHVRPDVRIEHKKNSRRDKRVVYSFTRVDRYKGNYVEAVRRPQHDPISRYQVIK